jgi:hypothetical protein
MADNTGALILGTMVLLTAGCGMRRLEATTARTDSKPLPDCAVTLKVGTNGGLQLTRTNMAKVQKSRRVTQIGRQLPKDWTRTTDVDTRVADFALGRSRIPVSSSCNAPVPLASPVDSDLRATQSPSR